MKIFELLKKGFGYVLLSMGVSRPTPKPEVRPAPHPGPQTVSGKQDGGS
jgi:hypothetical protein